jgi:lipoprotein NlpD
VSGRAARVAAALVVAGSIQTACAAPATARAPLDASVGASEARETSGSSGEGARSRDAARPARSLPPEARGVVHVVRKGETAWRIARTYDLTAAELLRANGLEDARELKIGVALLIPGANEARTVPKPGEPFQPRATAAPSATAIPTSATASPPSSTPSALSWPLQGVLYSRFGSRSGQRHDGIDVSAPEGTAVAAAADGDVIFAGEQAGYGSIVILRHAGGLVTVYAHASAVLVREGAAVKRGHPIARVGQTGRTSGPHLHFEVREGTRPRDPLLFLP